MDRKRLSQVQTSDLSESRVNDDFLFWLKTSGPNYLLAALLLICAYLGWNWFQTRADTARAEVWEQFAVATVPQDLVELAKANGDESGLALLANLNAADLYLQSIQSGLRFDRDPTASDVQLDDATRVEWMKSANDLYNSVITSARSDPNTSALAFPAYFGLAAIAESVSDFEGARGSLESARDLAKDRYDSIVLLAEARLANIDALKNPYPVPDAPVVVLPTPSDALGTIIGSGFPADAPVGIEAVPAPAPTPDPAPVVEPAPGA
ncbi:MAG: hypothetical protein O2800_00065 [Planctomycetota bacterium]|nr:hypothetical protein [Planctomycetota bacterium]